MAGVFLNGMKSYAVDALTSQLPALIETAQPQIEEALRKSLRTMRAKRPESTKVFAENWAKLNTAVQEEVGTSRVSSIFGGAKKRTRKTIKRRRNQRANV